MLTNKEISFLEETVRIGRSGARRGAGGPFGALVVLDDTIIGQGSNEVLLTNDPTAHAEIVAIRQACRHLGHFQLTGCDIYASCEPCPMCLGAIYWSRPGRIIYANTRKDAAMIGFDDDVIYLEIEKRVEERRMPFIHHPLPGAISLFDEWKTMESRLKY
ncbi:MAG TPA: nucleoside deaminase [Chitinophagaceae bacterium]|jgi:tRNA(Arg) A34 adenosine deaminase TadA